MGVRVSFKRYKPPRRITLRRKAPKSYFLDPKNYDFPYKILSGPDKGAISCDLLRKAIALAGLHYHRTRSPAKRRRFKSIQNKARRLYKRYCEGKFSWKRGRKR